MNDTPDDLVARKNLAFVLNGLGRQTEAVEQLRAVLDVDPDDEYASGILKMLSEEED